MLTIMLAMKKEAFLVEIEPENTELVNRFFISKQFAMTSCAMFYLVYDLFLISESFFSRLSNLIGYCAALVALCSI